MIRDLIAAMITATICMDGINEAKLNIGPDWAAIPILWCAFVAVIMAGHGLVWAFAPKEPTHD